MNRSCLTCPSLAKIVVLTLSRSYAMTTTGSCIRRRFQNKIVVFMPLRFNSAFVHEIESGTRMSI